MSAHRAGLRLALALAFSVLLGACAVQPPRPAPQPAKVFPLPSVPPVAPPPPKASPQAGPWATMMAGFVMPDCAEDPLIQAKAAAFTRHPQSFDRLLRRSLPLMMYVQKQLHAADIPSEFVMLPLLESSYDPAEPSRGGDAAGMWQLMPRTARLRGLHMSHDYDGRRDPVASTRVAVDMLTRLHRQFGDWRIVDMAYNAGPWAVTLALRKQPDYGGGPIPDLPVSAITRGHLAKLMALSCIVRHPGRYHVSLPDPASVAPLAVVRVPAGTTLASAADMAGMSESRLRALNPGYRGHRIPAHSPRDLLLPAPAGQSLLAALTVAASESVAQVDTQAASDGDGDDAPPLPDEPAPPPTTTSSDAGHASGHHRVRSGDTLWSIAQHYHVSVKDLKRWNDLDDSDIRPGEVLRIRG